MSNKIRVLLADDHAVVRAGIRQFLEHAPDIEVTAEADDGQMACQLLQTTPIDVAVLDIQMPYLTGIEVTRWIKAQKLSVGVLVLTGYDDDPYILAVLQAGASGYVLKTASPADLIQAVHDVYEGKIAFGPTIAQKVVAQVINPTPAGITPAEFETLTEREQEVLHLASLGYTNKAIGVQLGISDRTVQGHLAKIYAKLNASSRTEAVMRGVELGLITPHDKRS